jgi:hypothetical protein
MFESELGRDRECHRTNCADVPTPAPCGYVAHRPYRHSGFSHHVTQRGIRRQKIFFEPSDDALYRVLLAERCRKAAVEANPALMLTATQRSPAGSSATCPDFTVSH